MITVGKHFVSIMVLFAVTLHLTWAAMLWIDDAATNATAVSALYRFTSLIPISFIMPAHLLAIIVATAAIMALVGIVSSTSWFLLLIPQQILLMMSAAGAVEAVWLGQFADGIQRSHAFIAADQMYAVLAAIGHTAALICHAIRPELY